MTTPDTPRTYTTAEVDEALRVALNASRQAQGTDMQAIHDDALDKALNAAFAARTVAKATEEQA